MEGTIININFRGVNVIYPKIITRFYFIFTRKGKRKEASREAALGKGEDGGENVGKGGDAMEGREGFEGLETICIALNKRRRNRDLCLHFFNSSFFFSFLSDLINSYFLAMFKQ